MNFDRILKNFMAEMVDHENQHVDEFNQIFDENEELHCKVETLEKWKKDASKTLDAQHKALKVIDGREALLKKEVSKLSLIANKSSNLEHELKVLRKESKAQKDQIKRLKSAGVEKDKRIKRLEKSQLPSVSKQFSKQGFINNPELGCMYTLFTNNDNNGELIQLYPHNLTMRDGDREFKGYMCWCVVIILDHSLPLVSKCR